MKTQTKPVYSDCAMKNNNNSRWAEALAVIGTLSGVMIACIGFIWIAMNAKIDGLAGKMDSKLDALAVRMEMNMEAMTKEFRHIRALIERNSSEIDETQSELDSLKSSLISSRKK